MTVTQPEVTLPTTTGARLREIADHLEAHPEEWMQEAYLEPASDVRPSVWAGRGHCGTAGCIAGHGVLLTPRHQLENFNDWDAAGRLALGLDESLGCIFGEAYDPADLPATLRQLADLPEPRTLRDAIGARIDLTGCDLEDADVRGLDCSHLTGVVFEGALADRDTRLPEGLAVVDGRVAYSGPPLPI